MDEHIPSGGYIIYTLYDCFLLLEQITPFMGYLIPLYENNKMRNPLRNELISYLEVSLHR